jgi:hypothetical protein
MQLDHTSQYFKNFFLIYFHSWKPKWHNMIILLYAQKTLNKNLFWTLIASNIHQILFFCICGFWLELNHMFCIYPCASLFIEFIKIQLTINIELNVWNMNVEVSLIVCFNDWHGIWHMRWCCGHKNKAWLLQKWLHHI